jgi:Hemerythrin HHE cation binding domain
MGQRGEGGAVDALTLLKKDHDEVKKMLKDLDATSDRAVKTRQDLFERLKFSPTVHEQMEEAVPYPELKEHARTKEIVLEAYEEHDVVDTILGELEQTPVDDEVARQADRQAREPSPPHRGRGRRDVRADPRALRQEDARVPGQAYENHQGAGTGGLIGCWGSEGGGYRHLGP